MKILEQVMFSPHNLKWIDLSFNELVKIDEDILEFKLLNKLYLHGNKIANFHDVPKIGKLAHIRHFQLHGNPCAKIQNYRLFVIGLNKKDSFPS